MEKDTAYEAVFERLLQVTGVKTDSALARLLDIKPQSVVAARKRRQIPPGWLVAVAQNFGISADWLFFGKGPMYFEEKSCPGTDAQADAKTSQTMKEIQQTLSMQERRIIELERLLAEAKDETLQAYRLAVGAMRPPVETIQAPPPPRYGPAVQPEKGNKPNDNK